MSLMLRVTAGLVAGLLLGLAIANGHPAWLSHLPALLEPLGTIFVDAIRLAVIPLVVSGLIGGIGIGIGAGAGTASRERNTGRLGARAFAIIVALLFASVLFAELTAVPLFAHLHLDPAAVARLTQAGPAKPPVPLDMGQWFIDLVPANAFKAAADGALLPLIVASIGFGLALSRVAPARRDAVIQVVHGISDASLIFVGYVVELAPFGVFALAALLTARLGLDAIRALVFYNVIFVAICWSFVLLVLYPAAILIGRRSLPQFLRATLPMQAVGFASRSSMAALPAAYEGARVELHLPEAAYSFFLPIAAAVFRIGAAMAQVVGVVFLARLYGVTLGPAQLTTMLFVVVVTSMTAPGIPGGSILVIAPVLAAANIPVAGIALLLGADTIPDMFRTAANVTGWLAAASILEPARTRSTTDLHG
jgi:proton glutamate symport protein